MVLPKNKYIGRKIQNEVGDIYDELKYLRLAIENLYILFDTQFNPTEKAVAKATLESFHALSQQIEAKKELFAAEHDLLVLKEQERIAQIQAEQDAIAQAKLDAQAKAEAYSLRVAELIGQGLTEEEASTQAYSEIYSS